MLRLSYVTKIPQLGVCTADGSSGLTGMEHIQHFFADPSTHCVGYGDRLTKNVTATATSASASAVAAALAAALAKNGDAQHDNIDGISVAHAGTAAAAAARVAALEVSQSKLAAGAEPALPGKTELSASACPALLVRERER